MEGIKSNEMRTYIYSHNYELTECHTLSSDLIKSRNNTDHHVKQTHNQAKFNENQFNSLI